MSSFLMTYQKIEADCGKRGTTGMSLILLSAIFPKNSVQCVFIGLRICNLQFSVHFPIGLTFFSMNF